MEEEFSNYLSDFITAHKKRRIEELLDKRTRYLTLVLENIYKPHNASAVIRTADCFGIQDVHIIERENSYKINPYVTRGAAQWVDIYKYTQGEDSDNPVEVCIDHLHGEGYKVYATSPQSGSLSIHELQPHQKTALVFGNEHEGVSEEVISKVDGLVHIPMYGFSDSFNLSVSASIFLFDLLKKAKALDPKHFYLTEEEKQVIRHKWYRSIVKQVELHEKEFYKKKG